jgi:hypothetical protein
MITKIPKSWNQEEINEYFNIRVNTIEKFMPQLIIDFANIVPAEDTINASAVLRPKTKEEMLGLTNEIKDNIKKKRNKNESR